MSLDMLAKEGIVGLRRAKRRNMERYINQNLFYYCYLTLWVLFYVHHFEV